MSHLIRLTCALIASAALGSYADAATLTVNAGDSIQAVVNRAAAGDTILVMPGRYKETVLTWIGDFNPRMLKVCENLGATNYRTLAPYRYLFDRTKPFERLPTSCDVLSTSTCVASESRRAMSKLPKLFVGSNCPRRIPCL